MKTSLALLALVASATVAAQQPPAPDAENKPRPLNLKIDEAPRGAPRVTFDTKDDKAAATNLPGLGAGARPIDKQPTRPGSSASPYPADTNPTLR